MKSINPHPDLTSANTTKLPEVSTKPLMVEVDLSYLDEAAQKVWMDGPKQAMNNALKLVWNERNITWKNWKL
jgi:hypothetical protein